MFILFVALHQLSQPRVLERAVELLAWIPISLYALYLGIAVLSVLYASSRVYAAYSAGKSVAVFLLCLSIVATAERSPSEKLLRVTYAAYILGWLTLVIAFLLNRELVGETAAFGYRLAGGIFGDYGALAAVSGAAAIFHGSASKGRIRVLWSIVYALSWVFLYLSRTRGTLAGAVLILLVLSVLARPLWIRVAVPYLAILIGFIVALFGTIGHWLAMYLERGQELADIAALSGRTAAFHSALQGWHAAPIWGKGFGSGSVGWFSQYAMRLGVGIGAPHDALSKVLLDLGMIGLIVLVLAVFGIIGAATLNVIRSPDWRSRHESAHWLALIGFVLLISIVSEGVAGGGYLVAATVCGTASIREARFSRTGHAGHARDRGNTQRRHGANS